MTLPVPETASLEGAPKIDGCANGAALHADADTHSGDAAGAGNGHDDCAEHSCASYTFSVLPSACGTSFSAVVKKTSPPVSLASKNADSPNATPEEISDTQPPELTPTVESDSSQLPTPTGSYSYTSSLPLVSCDTNASLLFKRWDE